MNYAPPFAHRKNHPVVQRLALAPVVPRAALAAEPASSRTTFAWLIERNGTYLIGRDWTTDPWRAERFASFEQAEVNRMRIGLTVFRDEAKSVEHGFLAGEGK